VVRAEYQTKDLEQTHWLFDVEAQAWAEDSTDQLEDGYLIVRFCAWLEITGWEQGPQIVVDLKKINAERRSYSNGLPNFRCGSESAGPSQHGGLEVSFSERRPLGTRSCRVN
jgi:hypothetical protein